MKNYFFDDEQYYFKGSYLKYLIVSLISKLTLNKIKGIEKRESALYSEIQKSGIIKLAGTKKEGSLIRGSISFV